MILITLGGDKYPNLETSPTITNEIINKHDTIIIKDCRIVYKDLLYYLGMIYQKGHKLLYVNNQIVQPLVTLIELMGGYVYTDLDILDSEDYLQHIVENLGSSGMEKENLKKYTHKLMNTSETLIRGGIDDKINFIKTPIKFEAFKSSLNNVVDYVSDNSTNDTHMRNMLLGVIKTMIDYEEQVKVLKQNINDLQNSIDTKTNDSRSNMLFEFPTYNVGYPTKKVLYVVEYSPCRYITTFLMNYTEYINTVKNRKSRMLIILPKLSTVVKRYNKFPTLTEKTSKDVLLNTNKQVYITYEPRKKVLDEFLKDSTYDLYVVLDLSKSGGVLTGSNVVNFGAVSSLSDINKFGVNPNFLFTPFFKYGNSVGLTKINNYSTQTENNKKRLYFNTYNDSYVKLDRDLDI